MEKDGKTERIGEKMKYEGEKYQKDGMGIEESERLLLCRYPHRSSVHFGPQIRLRSLEYSNILGKKRKTCISSFYPLRRREKDKASNKSCIETKLLMD